MLLLLLVRTGTGEKGRLKSSRELLSIAIPQPDIIVFL